MEHLQDPQDPDNLLPTPEANIRCVALVLGLDI